MKKFVALFVLVSLTSCHRKSFEERVADDVAKFNREETPKRMDPVSILDSMSFDERSRTLSYYYTLEGMADDEELLSKEVRDTHREGLLKNLRGSIQLKPHKEQGFSFVYKYYSRKSGKVLIRERFTPNDYR